MNSAVSWSSGPDIGQTFPSFELIDQHHRKVELTTARAGRKAIVVFIRSADW